MKALELFNAGNLDEAIDAAISDVKSKPMEPPLRMLLAELLGFRRDWERADKQLDAVIKQSPDYAVQVALHRQIIRAEYHRGECITEGRPPELLSEVDAVTEQQLRVLLEIREGNMAAATEALRAVEVGQTVVSGKCDGEAFSGIRDLDDCLVGFCELLTSTGKYYWVPFHKIESIEFRPPERPRDLLWREARMIVPDGPDGVVYIPVTYPSTTVDDSAELRLGRATEWVGEEPDGDEAGEPIRGKGQKLWLIGENERSIMELQTLEFDSQD